MSDNTRAALFAGPSQPLTIQEFPLPRLGEGETLIRVTCCTLCGSDLHTYQGHRSTPTPTILGHEILGWIEALGPGDPVLDYAGRPVQIGDRVTWSVAASCGCCFFCERDLPQKCEQLFKYGHQQLTVEHSLSGGLANHCHLAAGSSLIRLPDELSDEVACPVNCATATVAAALRVAGDCRDAVILIQGAGMLGLTACAMAHSRGAREVIACDLDPHRLELARRFGATRCVQIADDASELRETVQQLTLGRGADWAIEVCGAASAVETGLPLLRIGGRYVLVGAVFPGPPFSAAAEMIVSRLLTIQGIHNYAPRDLADAVEFLVRYQHRYPFSELVADTFALDHAENAFQYAIGSRSLRVAVKP